MDGWVNKTSNLNLGQQCNCVVFLGQFLLCFMLFVLIVSAACVGQSMLANKSSWFNTHAFKNVLLLRSFEMFILEIHLAGSYFTE